ncbi:MAG: hypothetical protein AOA65_1319 [Candidatus Bathyarchaeota archaeon BA1]|nr:MAG: hypothetical protein AOA65_1319 [Candidatus Bathyarchaeota archaeon BA1]
MGSKGKLGVFITLAILAFALSGAMPISSLLHGQAWEKAKTRAWPEGYKGFEFEVIADTYHYTAIRVVEVHGVSEIKAGDIYYLHKLFLPDPASGKPFLTLQLGEYLGWDERGFHVYSVKPPEKPKTQQRYPISGTVYPGHVNEHGYHYLYLTQLVEIECYWTPSDQAIMLGLIHRALYHFYYVLCYDGYALVGMYPPYEGCYSIGVGNPSWNQYPIDYNGWYTIYP